MRTGWWLPVCLLVLGSIGYTVASRLMFAAPLAVPGGRRSDVRQ
jgi:hypothetical protein